MDKIALPSGTVYIKFSVVTHLFATAMCPQSDEELRRKDYAEARGTIDRRLSRAVELGDLRVCDPLTLAPHRYPVGDALREAVVLVDELSQYAARHGLPPIDLAVDGAVVRLQ